MKKNTSWPKDLYFWRYSRFYGKSWQRSI